MKSTLAIPLLIAGALLLPIAAVAQATGPATGQISDQTTPRDTAATSSMQPAPAQSSSSTSDQSSIPAKIKAEMAAENIASSPDINVDTDSSGGVVLSGTAQSQEDLDRTLSIARSTTGVTSVRNDVRVKSR
jgi:hyperosmotically inducible periplasmic protein